MMAGCGGGSPTSAGSPSTNQVTAKAYMATTCSAVLDWLNSILGQVQTFKTQEASATSLKEARSGLVGLVGQTVQDSDTLITTVKTQGAPAVSNGEAVHAKLLAAFEQVRSVLSTSEQKAKQLPVDDPAAFKKGATQIGQDINSQLSGIGNSISDFGPELDAAASADSNCQKLASK
jgi:hypothetical protein